MIVFRHADPRYPSIIAGLPGHPIEDVRLSNIQIEHRGGLTLEHVAQQPAEMVNTFFLRGPALTGPRDPFQPPEQEKAYPEPSMFGLLPAHSFYVRHAKNISVRDVEVRFIADRGATEVVLEHRLDGYGAGPSQSLQQPLGVGGESLHRWLVGTRMYRELYGNEGGTTGVDDAFARRSFVNVGAWIMGRNMFGPVRGPWPDFDWKGWWGDEPPYRCPVFVLTHHARPPLEMAGGTVFHFVTGGIHEALARARAAAGEKDIRIGGGASTIRQYLEARLIDEMHIAVAPVLLGGGEHLFAGLDLPALGYRCSLTPGEDAAHFIVQKAP